MALAFVVENKELQGNSTTSAMTVQANLYKPRAGDYLTLVLPEKTEQRLCDEAKALLGPAKRAKSVLGNDVYDAIDLAGFSAVVLCAPRVFKMQREGNKIDKATQRMEMARGSGICTASRVWVFLRTPMGKWVPGADGSPQLFALKLTGYRTGWGSKNQPGSIPELDSILRKEHKQGVFVLNMFAVGLGVKPVTYGSGSTKAETVEFSFASGMTPEMLPEEQQKAVYEYVTTDEFLKLAVDPFGIEDGGQEDVSQPMAAPAATVGTGAAPVDLDSIPFGDGLSDEEIEEF